MIHANHGSGNAYSLAFVGFEDKIIRESAHHSVRLQTFIELVILYGLGQFKIKLAVNGTVFVQISLFLHEKLK